MRPTRVLGPRFYPGKSIDVYLFPGSLVIEFREGHRERGRGFSALSQAFYVLEYDDIAKVTLEGDEVVLRLETGETLRLEVDEPRKLYEDLVRILLSIGKL